MEERERDRQTEGREAAAKRKSAMAKERTSFWVALAAALSVAAADEEGKKSR